MLEKDTELRTLGLLWKFHIKNDIRSYLIVTKKWIKFFSMDIVTKWCS